MSDNALLEIGIEEIPHEVLTGTLEQLGNLVRDKLAASGVETGKVSVFGTPRRLAVLLSGLNGKTPEKMVEKKGPSWQAAFDKEEKPTRALEGFLNANQAKKEDIQKKNISGADYVFISKKEGGQNTKDILPGIFKGVISSIEFPKTMKWGEGKMTFVRPIRWIASLYNAGKMDMDLDGLKSSNVTYGHRVFGKDASEIKNSADYIDTLRSQSVLADPAERKNVILDLIAKMEKQTGAKAIVSDDLLDTLVNLTEFPHVTVGTFEPAFLDLPKEVLISEMVEHQKYIPLEDKNGKLVNKFIIITNTEPSDTIVQGNERVIRSRFSDGKFFFDEDRKKKLSDYVPGLKTISFARELGTLEDKAERIAANVSTIASIAKSGLDLGASAEDAKKAARLCKADLTTNMVREFTELQGIIGSYYAAHSGEKPNIAAAVREHYWPRFSGDSLPSANEGILVSLADRFDNLLAMYAKGNYVSGSKDPYALRRQTLGIIRILIEKKIHLDIRSLIAKALPLYEKYLTADKKDFEEKLLEFITSRIKTVLKEYGFSYDEIEAGITSNVADIYDAYLRLTAIHEARKTPDFTNLAIAFKRVKNIIKGLKAVEMDESLLQVPAEKDLYKTYNDNQKKFMAALKAMDYAGCVSILTSFKPAVDKFFDDVMVMDKDAKLKNNRVSLLSHIDEMFMNFIDFEKIVVE